ncbi:MAG TPA: c-type cytochrome domain-containing protein, partial [Gammaproteobacteria bacterium]|nr:c-type cytochrome domain-containing protein [Gammaproteobacteria bacterium]
MLLGVGAAVLYGCAAPNPDLGALAPAEIDYNWHVRPILSENCFKCHGPDPSSRKAGLRLDVSELAMAELPETPGKFAIVPGNIDRSELVSRIRATNVDDRMPPESTHKTLSAQQMAILEQWIANGA